MLVGLSAHGFGHVAQAAPAINALGQLRPDIRFTLYTKVSPKILKQFYSVPFEYIEAKADVGMIMNSALEISAEESFNAYEEYHRHWDEDVKEEAKLITELSPDLVVADIPYRIVAAAAWASVPAVGLCSLNWADIYKHYCGERFGADAIHQQMLKAYNQADKFLRPSPGMPMPGIERLVKVAPIVGEGSLVPDLVRKCLNIEPDQRIALVALGGVPTDSPTGRWPSQSGMTWLVPEKWNPTRKDFLSIERVRREVKISFADLVASCDAVLLKPGYNLFVEAAAYGVPILFVRRNHWPEEPYLVEWLEQNARCREMTREQYEQGDFAGHLEALFAEPAPTSVATNGASEVAEILSTYL